MPDTHILIQGWHIASALGGLSLLYGALYYSHKAYVQARTIRRFAAVQQAMARELSEMKRGAA
jgi:hypothetical protein